MGYDDGAHPPPAGRFPVDVFGPHVREDALAGRTTVVDDTAADARTAPHHARVYGPQRVGAYLHVPLRRAGAWVAALLVDAARPRAWTEAEVTLARKVAERAWGAVETARLAAAERGARVEAEEASLRLQEQAAELEAANEELQAIAAELEERSAAADRARAEAEGARSAAEAANAAKAQFRANMSHELRTPLNAISGYVQLLDMGLHGPVTDEQRHVLGRVARAQRYLLGLINDVLNYARVERGRVAYDVRETRVADVLAEVRPLVEPQLAAKRLAFAAPPADGGGAAAWADADKLAQVLLNLLANAVQFTPAGGRVEVALAEAPEVVLLRVADTGRGIPADKREAVFEPFVQVGKRYAGEAPGTGLGLAISRELARGMGGDLTVESAEGRGATFTVTLRRVVAADGRRTEGEGTCPEVVAGGV